jgi:hypothetical protein
MKCPKCCHDGNGLHLCRGGNLLEILLEKKVKEDEILLRIIGEKERS